MSGLDNEKMKTKQNNNKKKEPKALKAFHEVKFKKQYVKYQVLFPQWQKRVTKYVTDPQELQVKDTQGNKLHILPLTACE